MQSKVLRRYQFKSTNRIKHFKFLSNENFD